MKIKFFTCLVILALLFSCGKDDDTSGSFFGTWVATNIDITDCENFTLNDMRSVQCTDNSCYRLELRDTLTYSFQTGQEFENGTWSADGAVLTFCFEGEDETVCRTATGILSTSGLRLSFEEGNAGCITSYIMVREEEDEVDPG